jgi:hypothetical protein
VREDDAEPELLDDESLALEEGAVVAMAVKESPLVWRAFPDECVELSEEGIVATEVLENEAAYSHVTTGVALTEGRHFWEVELLSGGNMCNGRGQNTDMFVGVTRPNLDSTNYGDCSDGDRTDSWFAHMADGALHGNSKYGDDKAGEYEQGDRVGVLLDLNKGSLLFFKNGVQHGPGYAAGSVTGPVVAAVEFGWPDQSVKLHANVAFPAGHAQ